MFITLHYCRPCRCCLKALVVCLSLCRTCAIIFTNCLNTPYIFILNKNYSLRELFQWNTLIFAFLHWSRSSPFQGFKSKFVSYLIYKKLFFFYELVWLSYPTYFHKLCLNLKVSTHQFHINHSHSFIYCITRSNNINLIYFKFDFNIRSISPVIIKLLFMFWSKNIQ